MNIIEREVLIRRAVTALWIATCIALLAHVLDSRRERQEVRADRAEAQLLREQRQALRDTPTSKFFVYEDTRPVDEAVALGKPIAMQSTASVYYAGDLYHDDRLRCWPIDNDGNLGRGRLLPRALDVVSIGGPRLYGPEQPDVMPPGFTWSDGEWLFAGPLPDMEADCVMISTPCVEPLPGIRKCQQITSEWIYVRESV